MKAVIILLISFYQRFISPYKGFRCAHNVLYRESSCSVAVKQIIHEHGVFSGWALINQRFRDCREASFILQSAKQKSATEEADDNEEQPKNNPSNKPKNRKKDQGILSDCCCLDLLPSSSCLGSGSISCGESLGCDAIACEFGACLWSAKFLLKRRRGW